MRIHKYITRLILYRVSSRLVTLLKFGYAPTQVSDVLILTVWLKPNNVLFQIFPFLVPEMSTSFPPYITQVIVIRFTWFLQLL
jgi:hypothetical protein